MSRTLKPIWRDDSLVFQWGDFSLQEQSDLIDWHKNIVRTIPDESFALARRALDEFADYFALLQDVKSFDPRLRIVCCYVRDGRIAECKKIEKYEQPTYAIQVNINAVHVLERQARFVSDVLRSQLSKLTTLTAENSSQQRNCALVALMFVFLHELAHIVRGHLEWPAESARQERRALELDADFIAAGYVGAFIRRLFENPGVERSDYEAVLQGCFAIVALYSALSSLPERDRAGDKCDRYHSAMARLQLVAYRITEATGLERDLAVTLVRLLMEGCKTEIQQRPFNAGLLDYFPDRHEHEFGELRDITAPRLLELELAGKLRGWRLK